MSVIVEIPSALKQFTGNLDEVQADGKSVGEVFASLCSSHEELQKNLYDEQGKIRSFINVYVNDEDIRYGEGLDSKLKDGDRIQIVPSIAGGITIVSLFPVQMGAQR